MESMYAESGVIRRKGFGSVFTKTVLIVACVLFFLMGITAVVLTGSIRAFFWYIPVLVLVIGTMLVLFPRLNVEYEYIFCDGQLDIARIRGKVSRKNLLRVDFENIELVAPYRSESLRNYQGLPKKDFSSGYQNDNIYVMIAVLKDKKTKIFFEPSDKMLNCMKLKSPSKILNTHQVNIQKNQ